MKKVGSIKIETTLLDYFSDGLGLCTLTLSRSSTQFTSYSTNSLVNLGSFWIDKKPTHYTTHIEDDIFYVCLETGELVALDSFSGMETMLFDLGSMIPLGVVQGTDDFFVLCGIVINDNESINMDICVCVCDKVSNTIKFQSQTVRGNFLPMVCDDDAWLIVNNHLYKFSNKCSLGADVELKINPRFSPIPTENYVAVVSDGGTMEIFNRKDLSISSRILVEKNSSPPVKIGTDEIAWFAGKSLYTVNLQEGTMEPKDLRTNIVSTALLVDEALYASDNAGNLVQYDLQTKRMKKLHLDTEPLWKPVHCDGSIFVASKKQIHQVKI